VDALPGGTSAPNTVITEQAVHALGLVPVVAGWLIQTPQPLTAAQIKGAQLAAAAAGLTVESRNDIPTMAQVINTATVFGVGLALAILFMSVGLIRAETASDLRILSATGASAVIRRSIIAATAGALALLGALLGTVAGYLAVIGWIRTSALNGGIGALGNVPVANLLAILVGMPLVAIAAEWLVAGRRQSGISRQPVE
jgi:putative ABC transport system permease protein